MTSNNLERMLALADEVFDTRNDPTQISVTEEVRHRLQQIHPGTMTEERDSNGPIAWILVIPTTKELMGRFIASQINEKELLDLTPIGVSYEAIYLCSALVLAEHRRRGLAKRIMVEAIRSICRDHPTKNLFYWSFSAAGERLSDSVAKVVGLPLYRRN